MAEIKCKKYTVERSTYDSRFLNKNEGGDQFVITENEFNELWISPIDGNQNDYKLFHQSLNKLTDEEIEKAIIYFIVDDGDAILND